MKSKFKIITGIAVAALVALPSLSFAGISQTSSFKMSLTIPAVVGVNVPIAANVSGAGDMSEARLDLVKSEEVVNRNGVDILLQTMVLK